VGGERFDLDLLDEEDPFEIDTQAAHLFKHPHLGIDDIDDVWAGGRVLVVPLAPARSGDPRRCRPIGCYEAADRLAAQYRRDR
jgi:hypothetical protein